jgi:hypothetical protein
MKIHVESLDSEVYSAFNKRLRSAPGAAGFLPYARSKSRGDSMLDRVSGAHLFGTKPNDAPFAFHLVVFPGLTSEQIAEYQLHRGIQIPKQVQLLYRKFNGLKFDQLHIYGLHSAEFQAMPNETAAYVPFDLYAEMEEARRRGTPYTETFPVGSVLLQTGRLAKLVLGMTGSVVLVDGKDNVIREHESLANAIEREAGLVCKNAA